MNENLFKINLTILINNSYTPADIFVLEHVLTKLINVKHKIINEETLIKEKNIIIIWDDYINIVDKRLSINIKDLNKENITLKDDAKIVGISSNLDQNIKQLEEYFEINIFEFENTETLLFERV